MGSEGWLAVGNIDHELLKLIVLTRRLDGLIEIVPRLSSGKNDGDSAISMQRGLIDMDGEFAKVEMKTLRELERQQWD